MDPTSYLTQDQHLARARVLLNTARYADAEVELRHTLAISPDDAIPHALLAHTLVRLERADEALTEAKTAITCAPDRDYPHYVHAVALGALGREEEALRAIRSALSISPEDADYYAFEGSLYLGMKVWRRALASAERGLQCDPEHVGCLNVRGQALVGLGRRDEGRASLETALTQDPEHASTHARLGWASLDAGNTDEAFGHFREALRIDPMYGWARAGIVEALKARNPLYRLLLRYFLWMSRLTDQEQWEVVGAIATARMMLRATASAFFPLYLLVLPLDFLFFCFRILTWIARPLFALTVRFNKLGRHALPKEDIVASNWIAICLITTVLSGMLGLALQTWAFLVPVVVSLMMIVPLSGVFQAPRGWGRISLSLYTGLLGLSGLAAFVLALIGTPISVGLGVIPCALFLLGWSSFFWIAWLVLIFSRPG